MEKAEIAKMAAALISDTEQGTLPIEIVIAKALTLAKVTLNDEAIDWLSYELAGYDVSTPTGAKYAQLTARWDGRSERGFSESASDIAHRVAAANETLEAYKQFSPANVGPLQEKAKKVNAWAKSIVPLQKVISNINVQLHLFASRVYVEAQFAATSLSIFERFQSQVDKRLMVTAAQVFDKLPFVFERLRNGEAEAISHALTSCRRIIDGFADAIFPARSEPVVVNGQKLDCGADKTKNRIRAFMASRIESDSRRDRINKNLGTLYDRVSAGVHADVAVDEAQALVLNTYLLLGELASLPPENEPSRNEPHYRRKDGLKGDDASLDADGPRREAP
jgi:hypothetical protein